MGRRFYVSVFLLIVGNVTQAWCQASDVLNYEPTLPSELDRPSEQASVPPPNKDDTVPPVSNEQTDETAVPVSPPKPAAPKPWKTLFFDNDFSYKNDPDHTPLFGEELKDMPFDFLEDSTWSFGGELQFRYMNEDNRLRPGGPARSTYDLWRWRNYVDFKTGDRFRLYVEMLDASIFGEELAPLGIDLNRWNIQNAFVDLRVGDRDGRPITFRVGRQELLYGAQYLISPLNWTNTRRNFEGFKLSSKGDTWDVDAFATRPVNTATGNGPLARFDNERDRADASRTFQGVYGVYHGIENQTIDTYWLWLREQEPLATRADGSRHTIGLRWHAIKSIHDCYCDARRVWDLDVEGAYQFGHDNDVAGTKRTVKAGFFRANLSHTWKDVAWQPTLKALYYWGSGDDDPADGDYNTFSVLFPLGHAFWGLIDNLSGQNLNDYSLQAVVKPTKKLTVLTALHWFDLATDNDVLYNLPGVPLGAPNTGTEIGEELDLIATYVFDANFSMQIGYSWFWNGTFINNNLPRDDASQFYLMTTLRY